MPVGMWADAPGSGKGASKFKNSQFPNFFARNPLKFPKTAKEMFLKIWRRSKIDECFQRVGNS
jgi:hypothetical protein